MSGLAPHTHLRRYILGKLSNNTVAVTGATSGIGLGLAEAFLSEGYNLVGTSRSAERLQATAGEVERGRAFPGTDCFVPPLQHRCRCRPPEKPRSPARE
jgi:NAD(P)-dependent dehydrogenase (short-subunit alcohol dehydrogenase family)